MDKILYFVRQFVNACVPVKCHWRLQVGMVQSLKITTKDIMTQCLFCLYLEDIVSPAHFWADVTQGKFYAKINHLDEWKCL